MAEMTPQAAMIFAAGFGTRMGDLTRETPKPMLPLGGRPMIDHAIDHLRDAGITDLVANTHYLHDAIAPHLLRQGVEISYETGDILDTGGGLLHALPLLRSSPVITINPDAVWLGGNPVSALIEAWRPGDGALLQVVHATRAKGRDGPGDFSLSAGRLSRGGPYIYTGVQIIDTALVVDAPAPAFSLNVIWDRLIAEDRLRGVEYDGEWCDAGHPGGLAEAERLLGQPHVRT